MAFSSGRSSPPAWSSHDDGDDDDGGAFASQGQRKAGALDLSTIAGQIYSQKTCAVEQNDAMAKTDWLLRGLVCGLMLLTAAVSGWALSSDRSAVVDVNRATVVELMTVPGMTEAWAKRIVRFRPYRRKTDLVDHGVVSPEEYKRIRDYIVAHRSMPEDSEQPASR